MGKSNKKVKSDRINALKKQYDAFLAEDRMRKERNDFILDRLDKMRYSTAAVQLWHRPTMRVEGQPGTYQSIYKTESYTKYALREAVLSQKCHSLDIPKKPLEETLLLQEISKKYILIPKQRSSYVNDYDQEMSSNVKDHGDWKSKYEILNQLKQSEKEEDTYKLTAQESSPNLNIDKTPSDTKHNQQVINNSELNKYVNNVEDALVTFKIESPKKHRISENKLCGEFQYSGGDKCEKSYNALESGNVSKQNEDYELEQHNFDGIKGLENKSQNGQIIVNPKLNNTDTYANSNKIEGVHNFQADDKCDPSPNTTLNDIVKNDNLQTEHTNINIEHSALIETYEQNLPVMEHNSELVDSVNVLKLEENGGSSIPVINTNDMLRALNNEPHVEDIKQVENVEYPIDIINVQEFTPNDDVELQDGVNVNPEGHAMNHINLVSSPHQDNHHIDKNNDDESTDHALETEPQAEDVDNQGELSGIEAFDAEQREMFYSEQAQENYGYDHAGTGDAYNPEYAQNENYQQNEDYTFYEGTQPEQPMAEINEHEETAQRYDQNYEEQYAGYEQEGYTQEQVYEQHSQGYEPQVYDQVEPESDQMLYQQQNYESVDCIEQQLDNEQGYIEKHNEEDNEMEKPAQEIQQAEQVADL